MRHHNNLHPGPLGVAAIGVALATSLALVQSFWEVSYLPTRNFVGSTNLGNLFGVWPTIAIISIIAALWLIEAFAKSRALFLVTPIASTVIIGLVFLLSNDGSAVSDRGYWMGLRPVGAIVLLALAGTGLILGVMRWFESPKAKAEVRESSLDAEK